MTELRTENKAGTDAWAVQLFAAIDAKDVDAITASFADDAVFRFGNAEPVHGRTAIREALKQFFASIGGLEHTLVGVWRGTWERGPVLAVESEVRYTRLDGSRTPSVPATTTLRMADERIQDYRIFVDLAPLFAAD